MYQLDSTSRKVRVASQAAATLRIQLARHEINELRRLGEDVTVEYVLGPKLILPS